MIGLHQCIRVDILVLLTLLEISGTVGSDYDVNVGCAEWTRWTPCEKTNKHYRGRWCRYKKGTEPRELPEELPKHIEEWFERNRKQGGSKNDANYVQVVDRQAEWCDYFGTEMHAQSVRNVQRLSGTLKGKGIQVDERDAKKKKGMEVNVANKNEEGKKRNRGPKKPKGKGLKRQRQLERERKLVERAKANALGEASATSTNVVEPKNTRDKSGMHATITPISANDVAKVANAQTPSVKTTPEVNAPKAVNVTPMAISPNRKIVPPNTRRKGPTKVVRPWKPTTKPRRSVATVTPKVVPIKPARNVRSVPAAKPSTSTTKPVAPITGAFVPVENYKHVTAISDKSPSLVNVKPHNHDLPPIVPTVEVPSEDESKMSMDKKQSDDSTNVATVEFANDEKPKLVVSSVIGSEKREVGVVDIQKTVSPPKETLGYTPIEIPDYEDDDEQPMREASVASPTVAQKDDNGRDKQNKAPIRYHGDFPPIVPSVERNSVEKSSHANTGGASVDNNLRTISPPKETLGYTPIEVPDEENNEEEEARGAAEKVNKSKHGEGHGNSQGGKINEQEAQGSTKIDLPKDDETPQPIGDVETRQEVLTTNAKESKNIPAVEKIAEPRVVSTTSLTESVPQQPIDAKTFTGETKPEASKPSSGTKAKEFPADVPKVHEDDQDDDDEPIFEIGAPKGDEAKEPNFKQNNQPEVNATTQNGQPNAPKNGRSTDHPIHPTVQDSSEDTSNKGTFSPEMEPPKDVQSSQPSEPLSPDGDNSTLSLPESTKALELYSQEEKHNEQDTKVKEKASPGGNNPTSIQPIVEEETKQEDESSLERTKLEDKASMESMDTSKSGNGVKEISHNDEPVVPLVKNESKHINGDENNENEPDNQGAKYGIDDPVPKEKNDYQFEQNGDSTTPVVEDVFERSENGTNPQEDTVSKEINEHDGEHSSATESIPSTVMDNQGAETISQNYRSKGGQEDDQDSDDDHYENPPKEQDTPLETSASGNFESSLDGKYTGGDKVKEYPEDVSERMSSMEDNDEPMSSQNGESEPNKDDSDQYDGSDVESGVENGQDSDEEVNEHEEDDEEENANDGEYDEPFDEIGNYQEGGINGSESSTHNELGTLKGGEARDRQSATKVNGTNTEKKRGFSTGAKIAGGVIGGILAIAAAGTGYKLHKKRQPITWDEEEVGFDYNETAAFQEVETAVHLSEDLWEEDT